jgi:hypothetical protein
MGTSGGKSTCNVVDKTGRRIKVDYRAVGELKLDSENPRDHTRRQVSQIAGSIGTFGFIMPAVVDANGKVIAGNGRILAGLRLGLTEVPTILVNHLSRAQIKAFQIADNKLTGELDLERASSWRAAQVSCRIGTRLQHRSDRLRDRRDRRAYRGADRAYR